MKSVVFLGTSAATPTKHRSVTCHGLQFLNGRVWLLDCGEGTQHQIAKCNDIRVGRIDNILITHLHGDHSFGLPGLLASMSLVAGDGKEPVRCIGPVGLERLIRTSLDLSATYITYKLEIIELEEGKVRDLGVIDGHHVVAYPMVHKVACFGFVVEEPEKPGQLDAKKAASLGAKGKDMGLLKAGKDVTLGDGTVIKAADLLSPPRKGKKVVLLGDTSDSTSLAEAARGCDLIVHEATFDSTLEQKAVEGGHSTSSMAGRFAHSIQAKKLVLTHFSMRYTTAGEGELGVAELQQEAQKECPQTIVHCAEDFSVFDI